MRPPPITQSSNENLRAVQPRDPSGLHSRARKGRVLWYRPGPRKLHPASPRFFRQKNPALSRYIVKPKNAGQPKNNPLLAIETKAMNRVRHPSVVVAATHTSLPDGGQAKPSTLTKTSEWISSFRFGPPRLPTPHRRQQPQIPRKATDLVSGAIRRYPRGW